MISIAIKAVWAFLTSKAGVIVLIVALLSAGVWFVYDAGKNSEKDNAAKTVQSAKDAAAKEIAKYKKQTEDCNARWKTWSQTLATAVAEAREGQIAIIGPLQLQLDEAKKQRERVRVVIKEVPKYVTVEADSKCVVTDGFVWLHDFPLQDAAVAGSGPVDVNAASGIALSHVADVDADNYGECVERGRVIDAWQKWYVENQTLYNNVMEKANVPVRDEPH